MPAKKNIYSYYEKYCKEVPFYKDEYEVVSFCDIENTITLKHIKCGYVFTKTKSLYKNAPNCNNKICKNKKREQTCLKKYGVSHINKLDETKHKKEQTNLKKLGVKYPLQNKNIFNKVKQTNLEKYGFKNISQSKKIRAKAKKTNIKKYGVENPSQVKEFNEKRKQTFIKKFGVDNPLKNKDIMDKLKKTNLEKYGFENSHKNKKVIEKTKQTNLEKYYLKKILTINGITPLFNIGEYIGTKNKNCLVEYLFKCNSCGFDFLNNLANGHVPKCPKCFPINGGSSMVERDIQNWLKKYINIENNKRFYYNKKYKYELDIFVPEKNIGIELNGIYWHSEVAGNKDRKYHIDKMNWFKDQGIQVVQVWDSEWIEKQDIVKSVILSKLGLIRNNIYARKCFVRDVPNKGASNFLEDNHLQGKVGASIKLGLYFEDKLVSILTFGKPRFNKKYDWEIIRFCNRINTNVVGGFSKLLKHFIKMNSSKSLITYADRRFSNGKLYENNGFNPIGISKPNYFYTKDYMNLETRVMYQKHKLKNKLETFIPELTEWENMQQNGFDRIWDCGNLSFELSFI